jgi:signal transduction histidine kinase/ActR/RegA family two-component response regulator
VNDQETVNILLVDDQAAKLLGYEAILVDLGENLIKAGSAAEALEYLLRYEIAVILIDVCMPDLDGFQLASMIRDHPRFQTTAIIFVSAIQFTDLDLLQGYQLGAVDYIPVPIIPDLLRAKVKVFAELYRKTRQLERLNAELENRVAERTAELARANAELEQRVEQRTREREAALAQIHQMQKLEGLGQLTGGVAHDFNNLLMAVLGNLELLRNRLANNTQLLRFVENATRGAEHGAALTKRLLAFARRQELKPEVVDLAKLVDGMVEMLRRSLGPTIRITTEFERDLAPIRIDPSQLELAIMNLAVNARDAMPNGGNLYIIAVRKHLDNRDMTGLDPGDYVSIRLRDTGHGMAPAILARAAEPFFTTKDRGSGTGLGLSMVDGLVRQSGGIMRLCSSSGEGTTVELLLPATQIDERDRQTSPRSSRPVGMRPLCVLVVDDDPLVLASTSAMIEDLGHSVVEAASTAEALEVVRSPLKIDVVISDYVMPGQNGADLAAQARQIRPGLPVAIATGFDSSSPAAIPSLPRLNKPYRQHELVTLLEQLIAASEESRSEDRSAPTDLADRSAA